MLKMKLFCKEEMGSLNLMVAQIDIETQAMFFHEGYYSTSEKHKIDIFWALFHFKPSLVVWHSFDSLKSDWQPLSSLN